MDPVEPVPGKPPVKKKAISKPKPKKDAQKS
jgi:hypothetical protein